MNNSNNINERIEILYNGLIKYNKDNYTYSCTKCNKEFKNKQSCITHVTMRKTDCRLISLVLYKCEVCGKEFKDKTKYTVHSKSLKCNKVKSFLKIGDDKYKSHQEKFMNLFLDKYLIDFWFNVFLLKEYDNNYEKNLLNYLVNLDENKIHDIYSSLIKKINKIGEESICLFISNVKKLLNKDELNIINKSLLIKWNNKLNEEVIKNINFD